MIARARNPLAFGIVALLVWAAPTQARFLQVDPVGYQDQFNLYAYVRNDPINGIDPTGENGYYVSRAAGRTAGLADHGFVVIADRPGAPIEAIFSYTDINGSLMSSHNDHSVGGTLSIDADAWNALGTQEAIDNGITFNVIDATDETIIDAGIAVDRTLETGEVSFSSVPSWGPQSSCNSNCAVSAVANLAREASGNSGDHPAPEGSRTAPGREQSERIEERIRRGQR